MKYYAVVKGFHPGIYTSWDDAKAEVNTFKNALFKSFKSYDDAITWYNNQSNMNSKPAAHINQNNNHDVIIYTDGSSIGNPGSGGYGIITLRDELEEEDSGGYRLTTNNRMELMGCIVALEQLKDRSNAILYSDSRYVVDSINKRWVYNWKSNSWKKSNRDAAENIDLWDRLLQQCEKHNVEFCWIKGHNHNPYNNRCDRLAKEASYNHQMKIDVGYESDNKEAVVVREETEVDRFMKLLD